MYHKILYKLFLFSFLRPLQPERKRGFFGRSRPASELRDTENNNQVPTTPPAPIASPEVLSQRSANIWDLDEPRSSVPHATSLDAITRRSRVPEPVSNKGPSRSATVSVLSALRALEANIGSSAIRPHTVDNFCQATRNHVAKSFPNTSSESDLQRYRAVWDRTSRERKSPSLSNVASDSLRHKFSIQDNGSAKFFQGALHTPNMGEKVAQVSDVRAVDLFICLLYRCDGATQAGCSKI
ncbi:hypothetical protein C0J52_11399 [Blattella germanica]|nr:hypothetical protein C0J52_11399 [Blattella germanica]